MALVCIFMCAVLINLFKSFEARASLQDAQASMGFESEVQIVWIVIVLSFAMLLLQLGVIFFEGARTRQ